VSTNGGRQTILVTGAAGGLAGTVVRRLADRYDLVGVDPRPLARGKDFPGEFHVVDYTHRRMVEIFRSHKIDILLHLGRIPVSARLRSAERYQTNVLGTKNLLELCKRYHVRRAVVLSTFMCTAHIRTIRVTSSKKTPCAPARTFRSFGMLLKWITSPGCSCSRTPRPRS